MAVRNYVEIVQRLERIARLPNVEVERIGQFDSGGKSYPTFLVRMGDPDSKSRVLINAGIHGDEPAGVEAALRFIEQNANNDDLLSCCAFTVFPCNNPTGWELNTRENADGIDLNRQFNTRKPPPEVAIISNALQGRCFDLVFEMHEDIDAPGLYLYEISEDTTKYVGELIIAAAEAAGCPVNRNDCIEGMSATGGLIRRKIIKFRKTRLPLAIYAYRTCGGHVITLEPPASKIDFEARVNIELMALSIAIGNVCKARGR